MSFLFFCLFFFNDTATTEIYTLSLHDALPILIGLSISLTGRFSAQGRQALDGLRLWQSYVNGQDRITIRQAAPQPVRSEEHTSELQSRLHLVCRLLL